MRTRRLIELGGGAVFLLVILFFFMPDAHYVREQWKFATGESKEPIATWTSRPIASSALVYKESSALSEPTSLTIPEPTESSANVPQSAEYSDSIRNSEPAKSTEPATTIESARSADSAKSTSPTAPADSVQTTSEAIPSPSNIPDRVVVMGRLESEDTNWVLERLPDWQHAIYTVDNQSAPLHTQINKGHEANPYLTYIVENYERLPSTIVFIHSHEKGWPKAWHTDNNNYDNAEALSRLNINFVQRNGYANLRCIADPGCPAEIQPFRDPPEDHRTVEHVMPKAWEELFGNTRVPSIIATPCCGQFAVSREQVLKRQRDEYEAYLDWLRRTPLDDETSGRVFEYLWHIIFGRAPV